MTEYKIGETTIEEYNPVDGIFYLICKKKEFLAKAYDLKTAKVIATAFERDEGI